MSEQQSPQMQMIRTSLLNSVFAKYNELRTTISALPIDQQTIGILKGLSYLDDGIVWLKEVILNSDIQLKKTEVPVGEMPVLNDEVIDSGAVLDNCDIPA